MSDHKKSGIIPGPACRTLLLPVYVRAQETRRADPVLSDTAALEMAEKVNISFAEMISAVSELTRISWIARDICFDRLIKDFIRKYPEATIVNIGCGLDTTYERVNNGSITWYDLDLPEVMELRKLFMKEAPNRKFVSGSFIDNTWLRYLNRPEHVLFVAGGVLYFYEEKVIRAFLIKLSLLFPSCEMLFDVTSQAGVRLANRELRKNGMYDNCFLKWGLKSTDTILSWSPRFRLLGKYCTFKQERLNLNIKNSILGWISDALDIQYIVHLKVKFDYKHLNQARHRKHY